MNKSTFEEIVKSKLEQHEVEVPDALWGELAQYIAPPRVTPLRTYMPYLLGAAAALCGVALGALVWGLQPTSPHIQPPTTLVAHHEPAPLVEHPVVVDEVAIETEPSAPVVRHTPAPQSAAVALADSPAPIEEQPVVQQPTAATERKPRTTTPSQSVVVQPTRKTPAHYHRTPAHKGESASRPSKGYTLSLLAANSIGEGGHSSVNNAASLLRDTPQMAMFNLNRQEDSPLNYNHYAPFSLGFTLAKEIAPHWSVESGVTYTLHLSSFYSSYKQGMQTLHYLGVPLHLNYHIGRWGRWSANALVGAEVDFNVAGYRSFNNLEGSLRESITTTTIDRTPQLSLRARIGAAYWLTSRSSLYLEPGVGYYFDNGSAAVNNSWKENPLGLSLQIGVRTHF